MESLCLFNISNFSSVCCAQNFSLTSCTKTMAKRMQEQKEEHRSVAKSKPMAMNLTSTVSTSSSSDYVKKPLDTQSSIGKPEARAIRNSKPDAASSSQGRLQDAYLGGLMAKVVEKPAATDKRQESCKRRNLLRPEIQEIQRTLKLEAGSGHIIFTHHITSRRTSHGESLFDRTTNLRPMSNG